MIYLDVFLKMNLTVKGLIRILGELQDHMHRDSAFDVMPLQLIQSLSENANLEVAILLLLSIKGSSNLPRGLTMEEALE